MIKICSFYSLPIEEQRIGQVFSIANSYPCNVGKVNGTVRCLVPQWENVKAYKAHQIDATEFTARYRAQIRAQWSVVKKWMDGLTPDDEMYLCCWERTGFCHRYLVAKLLKKFRPDLQVRVT
jgi:hypothetical protein